jgi:hypothetical protein
MYLVPLALVLAICWLLLPLAKLIFQHQLRHLPRKQNAEGTNEKRA